MRYSTGRGGVSAFRRSCWLAVWYEGRSCRCNGGYEGKNDWLSGTRGEVAGAIVVLKLEFF